MATWEHGGGFSVDADVRIEAHERGGLERLLRYCARPAFALERLRAIDPEHLVHESVKPGPEGSASLMLTPMPLLDRLAALIPPPRKHRHRYYGVLAPNSPLRDAATALAQSKIIDFITEGTVIREIPRHLCEPTSPPRLMPARGPPLWEMQDSGPDTLDPQVQSAPDYEFDQRIAW